MLERSTEEKIDYIYKEIRKQKRVKYVSLGIKIFFVLFLVYTYYKIIPSFDTSKYKDNITDKFSEIIQPITEKVVNSMIDEKTDSSSEAVKKYLENNNFEY